MMDYSKELEAGLTWQSEESGAGLSDNWDIKNVPLVIQLKSGIDLYLCFIINETKELLTVSATNDSGFEEVKTINKSDISIIGVQYMNQTTKSTDENKSYN